MARSTITSKGRITLPGAVRRHLGVATGDKLDFIIAEVGRVEIRPVSGSVRRLFACLRRRGARRVSLAADYQLNQPGASLDINGVLGGTLAPATVHLGIALAGTATLASVTTGAPWDIGIGALPLVPRSAGALTTIDGQVINLDVTDPSLVFLWGLFASPPFANTQVPLSFGAPVSFSFQMAVLSPTTPSGVALSQPVRLLVP